MRAKRKLPAIKKDQFFRDSTIYYTTTIPEAGLVTGALTVTAALWFLAIGRLSEK